VYNGLNFENNVHQILPNQSYLAWTNPGVFCFASAFRVGEFVINFMDFIIVTEMECSLYVIILKLSIKLLLLNDLFTN